MTDEMEQMRLKLEETEAANANLLAALKEIERRSIGDSTITLQEIAQRAVARAEEVRP